MKAVKITVSLFLVFSLFLAIPVDFATTKSLSLEEAIILSKENSVHIRGVLNQEFTTQNTIRKNIQNSYQLESTLDIYYDYIEIYNQVVDRYNESSSVHPWYKYIGRSDDYLINAIGTQHPTNPLKSTGLIKKLVLATLSNDVGKIKSYNSEIAFISMYMAFGENPSLTKETKFKKFKKNEAMLQNSVDLIETKYTQGLIAATKATEAGVIKLYVGLKDLKQGLEVKKDLLKTYESGLKDMADFYNQGLVSKVDFENQQRTVELQRLETENLQIRYDNLIYQLNKMCAFPIDTKLTLTTEFYNDTFKLNAPTTYLKDAYSNNMNHNNLSAELTFNEKNLEVMNKYLDEKDENRDFTKPIYYQEKVDQKEKIDDLKKQLANNEQTIETNITYAYNDLIIKNKAVEFNQDALTFAAAQLNSGIQSYKLGQITQLQLNQLKLKYANAVMIADQNVRAYNKGIENFKLLVNYGITY